MVDEVSIDAVRRVGCYLGFDVVEPAVLVLRVAPATSAGERFDERLDVTVDGRRLDVEVMAGDHRSVVHIVRSPPGALDIAYESAVRPPPHAERPRSSAGSSSASASASSSSPSSASADSSVGSASPLDNEQLTYLRQSRYCPSDVLSGFAAYELGHLPVGPELLEAVGRWVASRLTYESGSSGPLDSAIDSLLGGRGVCRDFAHLGITALRALDMPARLVSVYAPGLTPMDFHAVIEAYVEGGWRILDPTRLAPRQSLVRVSTGRDAADTAFVTVIGGEAELLTAEITAVIDGDLPIDDHAGVVTLA